MPNRQKYNQAPNPNNPRRPWGRVALAGGAALALAGAGLYGLFGGFENSDNNDRVDRGGDIPATASPNPGTQTPESPSATPTKTRTPTADPTTSKPVPSPSESKIDMRSDPLMDTRHTAANRYATCGFTFTNAGASGDKSTLSFSFASRYQRNADSFELRQKGQTDTLTWDTPQVILAKFDGNNINNDSIINTAEESFEGAPDIRGASVYPPAHPKKGTTYGVFIKNEAYTKYSDYTEATMAATFCGAIAFGNDGWRESDANPFPPDNSVVMQDYSLS